MTTVHRITVPGSEGWPDDRALIHHVSDGTACIIATEGAEPTRRAHVHLQRDKLLDALDALDASNQSSLREVLDTRTAERDAARQNALDAERKHGDLVGRLARAEQERDRIAEQRAHLSERLGQAQSLVHADRVALARIADTLGFPGSRDALDDLVRFVGTQVESLSLRAGDAEAARNQALTILAAEQERGDKLVQEVNQLRAEQADSDRLARAVADQRDRLIKERNEARSELARERQAHSRLADAHREAAKGVHPAEQDARSVLREANAALVEHAHWGGSVDDVPRRVRVVSQQREQFQRERDDARDALARIGTSVGFPGVHDDTDPALALVEFVREQVANLGRRASTAEDERDATRKVSDERGSVLDRITAALGCEPGDEVRTLHRRLVTVQTNAELRDANRALAARNQELEAKPHDDLFGRMTVESGTGETLDVTLEPTTWSAIASDLGSDGRGADSGSRGTVIGTAVRDESGDWLIRCTAWEAEPAWHGGRQYRAAGPVEWEQVRDRLGNIVAVAMSHRAADFASRQEAMAAMAAIAAGPQDGEGPTPDGRPDVEF